MFFCKPLGIDTNNISIKYQAIMYIQNGVTTNNPNPNSNVHGLYHNANGSNLSYYGSNLSYYGSNLSYYGSNLSYYKDNRKMRKQISHRCVSKTLHSGYLNVYTNPNP